MGTQQAKGALPETVNGIGPLIRKVQTGRFERSLSSLTAVEIFPEPSETTKGVRPPVAPTLSEQRRWRKFCLRTAKIELPVAVDKYRAR